MRGNIKVIIGYVLGAAAYAACLYIAFVMTEKDIWLNILIAIFGGVFGWIVGILTTPLNPDEKKQFSKYGQAIATFVTGYVVAKFDSALQPALEAGSGPDIPLIGRLLLFASTFCLGALFTFIGRRWVSTS